MQHMRNMLESRRLLVTSQSTFLVQRYYKVSASSDLLCCKKLDINLFAKILRCMYHPCPPNLLGSRLPPCLPPSFAFSWSMSVLRSLTMASKKSKEPSSPFCPRLPGSPLQPLGPVSPGAPGGPTAPLLQAQYWPRPPWYRSTVLGCSNSRGTFERIAKFSLISKSSTHLGSPPPSLAQLHIGV